MTSLRLITEADSAAFYLTRGLAAGEQADDEPRCAECRTPTDELVDLDGADTCIPCVIALVPDAYDDDHARDIA